MSDNNQAIEANLLKASEGDGKALKNLLEAFLKGPLFVPNRAQSHNLTFQPEYPNELVSILGVQDKERAVVPVFSAEALISEWFGSELLFRKISGTELLKILPEGWWIVINPGQEVEKELSPWEISRLKEGEPGMAEILEESSAEGEILQAIDLRDLSEGDYPDLKAALLNYCQSHSHILKLFLLIEKSLDLEGRTVEQLVIGAECLPQSDHEAVTDEIDHIARSNLIGDISPKVIAAAQGNNILLGPFKNAAPVYKKPGLLHRIKGLFKRSSSR